MKLKATLLSLVVVCFLTASCGSSLRFVKDVYIVGISPVMVPMAAGGDAYRGATDIRAGYQSGAWTEVVAFPLLFVWHGLKHTCYAGVHLVDAIFYPLYGLSEVSKLAPNIEPIDYYGNTWVDRWNEKRKKSAAVEANTGETK